MRRKLQAFTIIEVLISVVLISVVVLSIIKIQQDTRDMALYLSDRGKDELSNTLFLESNISKYHKDTKNAYDLLSNRYKIGDFESREVLKNMKRTINISEALKLEDETIPIEINDVMLKDRYSSRYMHFQLQ